MGAALGVDFTVMTSRDDATTVTLLVTAADTCLDAIVRANSTQVDSPTQGSACDGG